MAIIVFPDVRLPNSVIHAGVRGRQIRQNTRRPQVSGFENINVGWDQTLREFELGIVPMKREAWQDIETIHEITDGGAYGFLMEDPKDMQAVTDTQASRTFGVVEAITSTTFQLKKRYQHKFSERIKDRKITRPLALGFVPMVDEVPLSIPDYTLNVQTGLLTIPAAPDPEAVTWSGPFLVPVHFMVDSIDWTMVVSGPAPNGRYLAGPTVVVREVRE